MADVKKVWNDEGGRLYLSHPSREFPLLENAIYTIGVDQLGRFFLVKSSDGFTFDYKIYGLETKLVDRVIRTWNATSGNLGILLNGVKGTGKTVSSKIIANKLNQPIILVDTKYEGVQFFLNSITQDITIFIDEYEKVFGEATGMLTIMDGAGNSQFRRAFLLTTNELYVDRNLIQRPGRVRYLKKFDDLKPEIVEEIIDDCLEYPQFKSELINFISALETITVDIVKAVINEVNIHEEGPSAFEDIFNVKKLSGRYNVLIKDDTNNMVELSSSVSIYPRPTFGDRHVGHRFEIDNETIGTISRVINWTTIEVSPYKTSKGRTLGFDKPIILKMQDADIINTTFAYSEFGSAMIDVPKQGQSNFGKELMERLQEDNDKFYNEDGEEIDLSDSEKAQMGTGSSKAVTMSAEPQYFKDEFAPSTSNGIIGG